MEIRLKILCMALELGDEEVVAVESVKLKRLNPEGKILQLLEHIDRREYDKALKLLEAMEEENAPISREDLFGLVLREKIGKLVEEEEIEDEWRRIMRRVDEGEVETEPHVNVVIEDCPEPDDELLWPEQMRA